MKRRTLSGDERRDWLRLSRTPNVGLITFFQLIERFETAACALEALPDLAKKSGANRNLQPPPRAEIDREIEAAEKAGARFIAACEPDFSPALAHGDAPPPLIALRGHARFLHQPAIALVGARNASAVGRRMAKDLARDLGAAGYTIVSGLARGVDGECHAASLDTGTIAVLAGGVDQVYPPEHRDLYEAVSQRGAVVSEAPMRYVAQARDFPKRNRIIAGLSIATIVVEAAERSGSLITARCALEQNREVMAVPGSPLDPRAAGSNRLIKQGAALIENADDVLNALRGISQPVFEEPGPDDFDARPAQTPPALIKAVRQALSPTPLHIDEIVRTLDVPHRLALAAIAELELAGEAITHVGGLVSRAV
jgi:DNA processing protein